MTLMFDSVTPSAIGRLASTSPDAVAGYVDGRYRDIAALERDYPNHRHLSIAVTARDDADCLDIENGDAVPAEAPGWLRRQHARGVARPWLYANTSTWPAVLRYVQLAGIPRGAFVKWRADFDGVQELQGDDDAKQFTDHWQGRNVDASVVRDEILELLGPHTPPKKRPRPHPVRRPRPSLNIHPKVKGATGGAALAGLIIAALHALGVSHITAAETSAAGVLGSALAGYLTPAGG